MSKVSTAMPHVIFVNRYFYPDHSATSQLLGDLAFHLAGKGFDVAVLTSRQIYDDPKAALPERENIRGVELYRLGSTRFGRRHIPGRAIDYLSFHLSVLLTLRRLVRPGTIAVAMTDPPLVSVTVWLATRGRATRTVNWVQDLFPEVAEELGVLPRKGWVASGLRGLRDRSLRAAALNVAPGDAIREEIEWRGAGAVVVHNWSVSSEVRPVARDSNPLRESWSLGSDFVIGYSGNLGRAHEFDTIVAGMKRLHDDPVRLVVTGGGPRRVELEKQLADSGIGDRAQFHDYQPRARLAESLGVADVHLVSLRPGLERYIVPSKFYGIAAAGRPVIFVGATEGDIPRLIREADCGFVVSSGNVDSFVDAVRHLREDPERRETMGGNARRLLETRYSESIALSHWENLIISLDETGSSPC